MNRKPKPITLYLILVLLFTITTTAAAQEGQPQLEIRMTRDNGYGGFNNDIEGLFSIIITGPSDLVQVQFFIDDEMIGTIDEPPFKLQFNTNNFEPGKRAIYAIGILSDGSKLQSAEIVREFLSKEDAQAKVFDFIIPILAVTAVAILVSSLPFLLGKKGKLHPIGEYSMAGGTVCPRCQFPFSRGVLSPNMVTGKLERCPHCGKWSIRPRASQADLSAAEDRLRASRQENSGEIEVDPQDELRRALDDSRFED